MLPDSFLSAFELSMLFVFPASTLVFALFIAVVCLLEVFEGWATGVLSPEPVVELPFIEPSIFARVSEIVIVEPIDIASLCLFLHSSR